VYGGKVLPELILIENEKVIIPDPQRSAEVTFSIEQPVNDSLVGTPFGGILRYECTLEKTKYTVVFRRSETIYTESLGPTAAYRRFLGTCTLEITQSERTKTKVLSEFLWLGNPPRSLPAGQTPQK